jgi:hypothetical protein
LLLTLSGLLPLLSPVVWVAVATGREPIDHGIGHFVAYSDHTSYYFLFKEGIQGDVELSAKTYSPELITRIEPHVKSPEDLTYHEGSRYLKITRAGSERPADFDDVYRFEWALATAETYLEIGLLLWEEVQPHLELDPGNALFRQNLRTLQQDVSDAAD